MRFLGIGDTCDLLALYLRLAAEGHEVKVAIADPLCQDTGAGLVVRTPDWRGELGWIFQAGPDGIILFENVAEGRGQDQDDLRQAGFNVIGGSAYGDRLENDRAYAQSVLSGLGLATLPTHEFDDCDQALAFLDAHPGRYVLKFNGPSFASRDNYVGAFADGRDVRAVLSAKRRGRNLDGARFVLMDHAAGVEMGVGAYFNGREFLQPACLDWEHKRFFTGNMGELTGEMGSVVTYDRTKGFFARTLGRMAPLLRQHGYLGYINLNTIVNDAGIWPLEFTCRFGYPGFAILEALQITGWADLFDTMIKRKATEFATRPGFAVGIVITTPPFPYTRKQVNESVGHPVLIDPELSAAEKSGLHYTEIGLANNQLVTTGTAGWTMVVTGRGATVETARDAAYALAGKVYVPNMRYRLDIGDRLIAGDLDQVARWGFLDP